MMLSAADGSRSSRVGIAASAGLGHRLNPEFPCNGGCQRLIDIQEMRDHAFADDGRFDFAEFERQCRRDVTLFRGCLTDVELPGLAIVVGKALRTQSRLGSLLFSGKVPIAAYRGFAGPSLRELG